MKPWLKWGLSLILLAALVYFFWPLVGELSAAANLFRQARWGWLAVAVLVQVISYAFLTWLNLLALQPFPGRIGFGPLTGLLTAMAFIQIAIPSAGASGAALRVRLLGKYGYKSEEALFSLMVESLAEVAALASVGLLGVAYLLQRGEFGRDYALRLAGAAVLVCGLLWAGWRLLIHPLHSRRLLAALARAWNRAAGRIHRLDPAPLEARLDTFQANLTHYRQVPFWKFILASYGKVLLDVATLGACFYLVGHSIRPGSLLTGYGLILTFSGLAALPGGLGMSDAYTPVFFSWLGVPGSVALAAGLTYRLVAFWLLRFIGFLAWQFLEAGRLSPKRP